MHILIADDTHDVVVNFDKAIRKLGHTPILCSSLREASVAIENPKMEIDIAFIDNHFHNEGFGIDKIRHFRGHKSDMDVVITTKRDVRPDLVADVVNLQVGFFKKQSDDPTLLEAEISQRVNIRREKEDALRRKIMQLQKAAAGGNEGVRRLINFVTGSKAKPKIEIDSIESTGQHVIVPRFEKFQTIHVGENVEITKEFEVESSLQWKASTLMELGLGIDESLKFFGSKIGEEIKAKIKTEFSVEETKTLKGAYRIGHKLSLTAEDTARKIRRREYYRGIDHVIYKVIVKSACRYCKSADTVELRIYVPTGVVDVSVAFDKQGFPVPGEDGREAYRQLLP